MDSDLHELLQQTGSLTEDVGRMLQSKRKFTYADLEDLRNTLVINADVIAEVLHMIESRGIESKTMAL